MAVQLYPAVRCGNKSSQGPATHFSMSHIGNSRCEHRARPRRSVLAFSLQPDSNQGTPLQDLTASSKRMAARAFSGNARGGWSWKPQPTADHAEHESKMRVAQNLVKTVRTPGEHRCHQLRPSYIWGAGDCGAEPGQA